MQHSIGRGDVLWIDRFTLLEASGPLPCHGSIDQAIDHCVCHMYALGSEFSSQGLGQRTGSEPNRNRRSALI